MPTCRKIHKPMGRDYGERRRSPRISALDQCKANDQNPSGEETRTRNSRIKRKFDNAANFSSVSKLAKQVWKGRDSPHNEHHSADSVEWRSSQSQLLKDNQNHDHHAITNGKESTEMPAKHILELILDTLQRRDTYEIFAEPVDPDEVEDYYEIVKDPMDFGTMRAKLHEGMYENLEQFEHDVFLIPENAMHFNSSNTIYFRQARAIHELAKKVFQALKTDPDNFVLEFSGTRRRSMRKALSDTKDSRFSTVKSGDVTSPSSSTLRRSSKKNPSSRMANGNFFTGCRDGRLPQSSQVADRRSTYQAWRASLYNDKDSIDLMFYSTCKPLVLMNQGDISYKASLMSFVKDLGPTAQMVASKKLLGQHESNSWIQTQKSHISAATQEKSGSSVANTFRTFRDFANGRNITEVGEEANGRNMRANNETPGKEKAENPAPVTLTTRRGLHVYKNRKGNEMGKGSRDLNSSTRDDNVRPVILALENSHSNAADLKLRNKKSSIPSPWTVPVKSQMNERRPVVGQKEGVSSLEAKKATPLISQFTFDIPFLKARLNQMNVLDRGGGLMKRPSFEKGVERAMNCTRQAESIGSKPFVYNQPRPSLDKLDAKLALQL